MDYRKTVTMNPSGFVVLADYVPGIVQEIRYHSTYNFVGDRIDGYEEPCALLTVEAARALKAVSGAVNAQGYRLKVFDAYRPACAVRHFVLWGIEDQDLRMKPYDAGAAREPDVPAERHGAGGLQAPELRMVALRPGGRALPGHVLRIPGVLRLSEALTEGGTRRCAYCLCATASRTMPATA